MFDTGIDWDALEDLSENEMIIFSLIEDFVVINSSSHLRLNMMRNAEEIFSSSDFIDARTSIVALEHDPSRVEGREMCQIYIKTTKMNYFLLSGCGISSRVRNAL